MPLSKASLKNIFSKQHVVGTNCNKCENKDVFVSVGIWHASQKPPDKACTLQRQDVYCVKRGKKYEIKSLMTVLNELHQRTSS